MKKSTAVILMVVCFLGGCALTLFVFMSLLIGAKLAMPTGAPVALADPSEVPAIAKAQEVYGVLDEMYIGEMDEELMCDTVAEAMVYATGDRWSYYIPAEAFAEHMEQMNNSYVGIGVTVRQEEDGSLTVIDVLPSGPAHAAGVLKEDVFSAVDGTDCTGMSLTELRELIRGEEGTTVNITLLRGETKLDFTVERRSVETEVVSYSLMGDVGYIAIYNFDANAADKTIAAVEALRAQGAQSLLFDVRNNPGGLKTELLQLLDYLLPEGPLFRSKDYKGSENVDMSDSACVELPMAVLINQDSYSAAEFFAAALSEYGVAKTVGTQTCGKGYFQVTQPLSDGSALNISVGEYATPNGVSLAETGGLAPDVTVELSEEDAKRLILGELAPENDAQLRKALELLK